MSTSARKFVLLSAGAVVLLAACYFVYREWTDTWNAFNERLARLEQEIKELEPMRNERIQLFEQDLKDLNEEVARRRAELAAHSGYVQEAVRKQLTSLTSIHGVSDPDRLDQVQQVLSLVNEASVEDVRKLCALDLSNLASLNQNSVDALVSLLENVGGVDEIEKLIEVVGKINSNEFQQKLIAASEMLPAAKIILDF